MKKKSKLVVGVIAILTAVFTYFTIQLEFDYDFEKFFPENDPATQFYKDFREKFTTDNDFIIIAVENKEGVFEREFLKEFESLAQKVNQLENVDTVVRITQMNEQIMSDLSPIPFKRKYIDLSRSDSLLISDKERIKNRPELMGFFIDSSHTTLAMMVRHQPYLSKKGCEELTNQIEELESEFEFDAVHNAGRAIGQVYYVDKMLQEMIKAIILSCILVVIFLMIAYRSFWGVWIPLVVVLSSFVWITGAMGVIGAKVNLILTVLPVIMFVVAMSDVIHLVSKFLDELRDGKDKKSALFKAYKEVGMATLLTSITTAVGFLSLLFVNVTPIQYFGKYTALGVMLAFVLAYTLLPALLYWVSLPRISKAKKGIDFWKKHLARGFVFSIRNPKKILLFTIIICSVGMFFMSKVQVNNFLLDDLKASDPLKQEFQFFDKNLGGIRPFELAIQIDDAVDVLDYNVIQQVAKIDSFLISDYGLTKVNSLASVVKIIYRSQNMGNPDYYKIPNKDEYQKIQKQLRAGLKLKKSNPLRMIVDSTGKTVRTFSTVGDYGNQEISARNNHFMAFIEENIDQDVITVQITGTAHLIDKNMNYLIESMVYGLLLALAVVALIMGLLYRSLKMVCIALIPNMIPLLLVAAFMGMFGIDLKVTTSIIFTIGFGIAVDDTIHFMSKLKLELNKGSSVLYALKRTYLSTGRAIIITSLILSAGFMLLVFSSFLGTFYVGLLISIVLALAVISDLLVLPALIVLFYRQK